ncbi:MAG: response regulator [Planctomycetota bacterium]|nr:response regulator [Planctomycetota bacterium]
MTESTATTAKLILVVDDERAVVRALAKRCELLGLQVCEAHNAVEAMAAINQQEVRPSLLLVDYNMPGADGLTLCDMLKTNEGLSSLPVILLTGYDDEDTRRRCKDAGAHYVRKDVDSWKNLEPLICRLLGLERRARVPVPDPPSSTPNPPPKPEGKKILIIDDDPMIAKGLRVRLEALGYRATGALTGMEGYLAAIKEHPDLIVLDYKMPEGWGNTILGKLKSNAQTVDIPVIILSGMTDLGIQRDILRLGAECWINKPFEMKDFIKIIKDYIGSP